MKLINFGSLNIDRVYTVQDFVEPGQTIFAARYATFPGGKGLNQSIAAARAGAPVLHAGLWGQGGEFLVQLLQQAGVDTTCLRQADAPAGHAIIEVDHTGQNRIIVYGGTNQMLTEEDIDTVLQAAAPDDLVLLQNETNRIDSIIRKAADRGLRVAFNPSPVPAQPEALPLSRVSLFLVNELEGARLAGLPPEAAPAAVLDALAAAFPAAAVVLTLGSSGVIYRCGAEEYRHGIFSVPVQDTTAAGDTFCGFFLAALCGGESIPEALRLASAAAALTVTRDGAAVSIPDRAEVTAFLADRC